MLRTALWLRRNMVRSNPGRLTLLTEPDSSVQAHWP